MFAELPFGIDETGGSPEKIAQAKADFRRVIKQGARLSDSAPKMTYVLRQANLRPGDVIADVGCGSGFFEYAVLELQIPAHKVFALDIEPRALEIVRFVLDEADYPDRGKIELVQSKRDDVTLPADSLDAAFVINTSIYAATEDENDAAVRLACLKSLQRAIKPGGRLIVYENGTIFRETTFDQKVSVLKDLGFRQTESATQTGDDYLYLEFVR